MPNSHIHLDSDKQRSFLALLIAASDVRHYAVFTALAEPEGMVSEFIIYVVWRIPRGYDKPVVLVTAYRPDPERWNKAFTKRR
ncbi:hypothetical protein [Nitrosococcus watsonii]|uniref:Uncharacterized protein n=1 Tax=Nitrosococcus watsoni (strain C-113) TaxID=105559 RepID=D8KC31_NITWC|nr:hypothetical protein [Nitrosococcus watsonii]ADJ29702.1 hypothetical protein Nwat_2969 [Nitrosococcus watsonii C-113]